MSGITIPEIEIPDWLIEQALREEKSITVVASFDPRATEKKCFMGLMDPMATAEMVNKLMQKAEELPPTRVWDPVQQLGKCNVCERVFALRSQFDQHVCPGYPERGE